MQNDIFTYNFPTHIRFGIGARNEIQQKLQDLRIQKPLLVTDKQLSELPVFQEFKQLLTDAKIQFSIFNEIAGNPTKTQVNKGSVAFKNEKSDGLLAFGGGAAIDVAKCINVSVTHKQDLFDYEDLPGKSAIDDSTLFPLIAIPTTAGTGSEVGRSAVVSDDQTRRKVIIFSPGLLPKTVILDPQFQIDLPPSVTAATGMDALTHCIEAYLVNSIHPICDGIALEGIYQISLGLKNAFDCAKQEDDDLDEHLKARGQMMNAAMMGGVAFQKGLGVNHSCAHALSTVADLHHGLANAIMLPHTLLFNLPSEPEKFKRMAMTVGSGSDGLSFIKWVEQLNKDIEIPMGLGLLGITKDQIPALIDAAMKDACHPYNPRPVFKEDFEMLFKTAY